MSSLCSLLGYSRQAYYQNNVAVIASLIEEDIIIQEVLKHRKLLPKVGTVKLLVLLIVFLETKGIKIGRDSMFELLRRNNLLIKQSKRSGAKTTDSNHRYKKYPNLILDFTPTAANQLWVSDITYIHLEKGHCYLSLITDAYSRKIIGYCLHDSLSTDGCLIALEMALKQRKCKTILIHHSDRGVQYCSDKYVALLSHENNQIQISMTQTGDPRDNAIAERVNGVLKMEFLKEVYQEIGSTKQDVTRAINIYNNIRPHSSVDMLTPAMAHEKEGALKKRWKNYYKTKQEDNKNDD